jgi:hypothetical protein
MHTMPQCFCFSSCSPSVICKAHRFGKRIVFRKDLEQWLLHWILCSHRRPIDLLKWQYDSPSFFLTRLLAKSKQMTRKPRAKAPPSTMATVLAVCCPEMHNEKTQIQISN